MLARIVGHLRTKRQGGLKNKIVIGISLTSMLGRKNKVNASRHPPFWSLGNTADPVPHFTGQYIGKLEVPYTVDESIT